MFLYFWKKRIQAAITNRENYSRKTIFGIVYLGTYIIVLVILAITGIMSPSLIYVSCFAGLWVGTAFGGIIGFIVLAQLAPTTLINAKVLSFLSNFAQIIVSLVSGLGFGLILGIFAGLITGIFALVVCGIPYLIMHFGYIFFLILLGLGLFSEVTLRIIKYTWKIE